MSCTSVQNERRAFSFQHRLCSSEPGSKPSFSLSVLPLHFSEPSLPAVSLASTARQVQLGTLPGPITSTAHSLLLQAMICSGSSYFSSYFSLPRRTINPLNSISPTVIPNVMHLCQCLWVMQEAWPRGGGVSARQSEGLEFQSTLPAAKQERNSYHSASEQRQGTSREMSPRLGARGECDPLKLAGSTTSPFQCCNK